MMALPWKISETEMDMFLILESSNIDRIMEYDPAELVRSKLGSKFAHLGIRNVVITYATDADIATVMPMLNNGQVKEALRHLTRGWQFRHGDPEQYESMRSVQ